jgi:hypothetical protein
MRHHACETTTETYSSIRNDLTEQTKQEDRAYLIAETDTRYKQKRHD